jgi:hypothetical protein
MRDHSWYGELALQWQYCVHVVLFSRSAEHGSSVCTLQCLLRGVLRAWQCNHTNTKYMQSEDVSCYTVVYRSDCARYLYASLFHCKHLSLHKHEQAQQHAAYALFK